MTTRIFFATDVHGSDICWKKFIAAAKFYGAQILILGGDMTGKAVVPLVKDAKGRYRVELMEQVSTLKSEDEVAAMEKTISNKGYYPVRLEPEQMAEYEAHPEQVEELFVSCVLERVAQWLEWAESKLAGSGVQVYVCPGNDDFFEVDDVIRQSSFVTLGEDRCLPLDGTLCMISTGWANRTPWKTHREMDEPELEAKLEKMAEQVPSFESCIFNMHCPAHASGLDDAAELDENFRPKFAGNVLVPVGSKAVRAVIERHQPPLALFGHIHEARGMRHIGKTLCINPGSSYAEGTLLGARIDFDGTKIVSHTLTSG